MDKVKYIKVNTADRLPTQGDVFFTIDDDDKSKRLFDLRKRKFFGTTQPEFWLEPVPDREEEMRDMLEELVTHHFDFMGCGEIKELQKKAEQLLNELKQ